jgi:hypothetical protein
VEEGLTSSFGSLLSICDTSIQHSKKFFSLHFKIYHPYGVLSKNVSSFISGLKPGAIKYIALTGLCEPFHFIFFGLKPGAIKYIAPMGLCELFHFIFSGLKPGAINMSPLRGSANYFTLSSPG